MILKFSPGILYWCHTQQPTYLLLFLPRHNSLSSGPVPHHYRSFTITHRHNTLGRNALDEWSARRRDLYLKTHNNHNRQTSMFAAGFEPAIPASERQQTHALDRAATGTDPVFLAIIIFTGDSCFGILISLVLSTFLSIPQRLLTSINLSIMPYITAIITNSYRHMN